MPYIVSDTDYDILEKCLQNLIKNKTEIFKVLENTDVILGFHYETIRCVYGGI